MPDTPREDLERELQDPQFKRLYGAADAKDELAQSLYRVRDVLGLTQKDMATRLGVSQPYVAKLESGEANPTIGSVGKMLAELDLRIRIMTESLVERPAEVSPFVASNAAGFVITINSPSSLNCGYAFAPGGVSWGRSLDIPIVVERFPLVVSGTEAMKPWEAMPIWQKQHAEAFPAAATAT